MSETRLDRFHDASQWTFISAATVEALRSGTPILRGVYCGACAFFRPVIDACRPGMPGDSLASAANYAIAVRLVEKSGVGRDDWGLEDYNRVLLAHYETLLAMDPDKREMKGAAVPAPERIEALAAFFERLFEEGERVADENMHKMIGW